MSQGRVYSGDHGMGREPNQATDLVHRILDEKPHLFAELGGKVQAPEDHMTPRQSATRLS